MLTFPDTRVPFDARVCNANRAPANKIAPATGSLWDPNDELLKIVWPHLSELVISIDMVFFIVIGIGITSEVIFLHS